MGLGATAAECGPTDFFLAACSSMRGIGWSGSDHRDSGTLGEAGRAQGPNGLGLQAGRAAICWGRVQPGALHTRRYGPTTCRRCSIIFSELRGGARGRRLDGRDDRPDPGPPPSPTGLPPLGIIMSTTGKGVFPATARRCGWSNWRSAAPDEGCLRGRQDRTSRCANGRDPSTGRNYLAVPTTNFRKRVAPTFAERSTYPAGMLRQFRRRAGAPAVCCRTRRRSRGADGGCCTARRTRCCVRATGGAVAAGDPRRTFRGDRWHGPRSARTGCGARSPRRWSRNFAAGARGAVARHAGRARAPARVPERRGKVLRQAWFSSQNWARPGPIWHTAVMTPPQTPRGWPRSDRVPLFRRGGPDRGDRLATHPGPSDGSCPSLVTSKGSLQQKVGQGDPAERSSILALPT